MISFSPGLVLQGLVFLMMISSRLSSCVFMVVFIILDLFSAQRCLSIVMFVMGEKLLCLGSCGIEIEY